ncbi:MAG: hypothetical protein JXB85_14035 [Anaerolineales bacterium]|nr:hypothetical protein [Anaerolineales bacterium]
MSHIPPESSKVLEIYLLIAQYPMLASPIRRQMRQELFRRGIITPERFEQEIKEHAIQSQQREGVPAKSEPDERWDIRYHRIRRTLTDFYFAYNLPVDLLHSIIDNLLAGIPNREEIPAELTLRFNPELAPLEMVLRQAEEYESLPPDQLATVDHHLQELRVVLLKSLISDQLAFIRIAKQWFTTADFNYVVDHRIGTGKVGGKAAGMLLAYKILQNTAPQIFDQVVLPRSYFVGADVFYDFLAINDVAFMDQKYKPMEQIRSEYPMIQEQYSQARFPEEIADRLREILEEVGRRPLIVRSSSLLEDNFGTSFAGKYQSHFCPNQGTPKENLRDLTLAIRRTYASVYSPDALMYRKRMDLLDYDERMAILLQEVQGERHQQMYFPTVAGVAFSTSPMVWNPRLKREQGFVRLVLGLGTRAVERMANDYPRMVNLSHPQLRPEVTRKAIRYYSQHHVDLLDLDHNQMVTQPLEAVLGPDFAPLRWIASVDDGDTIRPPLSPGLNLDPGKLVLTFEGLLQRSDFVPLMKTILSSLAEQYQLPVDVEFTLSLTPADGKPALAFHLLQCRPQKQWGAEGPLQPLPTGLQDEDRVFLCTRMVPQGHVSQIEYLVYVDPEAYFRLQAPHDFAEVARLVGLLNRALEGHTFVMLGPGRWGSTDHTQGVPVTYADIFNTRALIELASQKGGYASEPSYGTHFFQDLVESQIYPLAISLEEAGDFLNLDFLVQAKNRVAEFIPQESAARGCIRVVHVPGERPGWQLEIAMDGESGLGYLVRSGQQP